MPSFMPFFGVLNNDDGGAAALAAYAASAAAASAAAAAAAAAAAGNMSTANSSVTGFAKREIVSETQVRVVVYQCVGRGSMGTAHSWACYLRCNPVAKRLLLLPHRKRCCASRWPTPLWAAAGTCSRCPLSPPTARQRGLWCAWRCRLGRKVRG